MTPLASTALWLSPSDLGFSAAAYPAFRQVQQDAIAWLLAQSSHRIKGICLPTGSGKSLVAAAYAKLPEKCTVIVVSTKALQDQYRDTLAGPGWADLRGWANYPACGDSWCKREETCRFRLDCAYANAVQAASKAQVMVTNYAAWLHLRDGIASDFDCLILDEGDTALDHLGEYVTIRLPQRLLQWCGLKMPTPEMSLLELKSWAAAADWPHWVSSDPEMRRFQRQLNSLPTGDHQEALWVRSVQDGAFLVEPLQPEWHCHLMLRGIADVVLMSATLTEEDLGRWPN